MVGSTRYRAVAPLAPPPSTGDSHGIESLILCSYRNSTNRMVIVRARGVDAFFLERVVFPFEIMTFHCPRQGEVEVIMRSAAGREQSEWVAAEQLLAGDSTPEEPDDWRPHRNMRGVSVRANASSLCLHGNPVSPLPGSSASGSAPQSFETFEARM
ncbi:MAG: DUF1830 domain-containing protein [Cyanobacteriota bacterium]